MVALIMKSSSSNPRHRSGVEAKLCLGSWCHHEMEDLGSFGSGEMQILPLASISAISAIISETFPIIFHHFPSFSYRNGHPILQYSPIGPSPHTGWPPSNEVMSFSNAWGFCPFMRSPRRKPLHPSVRRGCRWGVVSCEIFPDLGYRAWEDFRTCGLRLIQQK